jgi:ketosteroid isomerase-like protein
VRPWVLLAVALFLVIGCSSQSTPPEQSENGSVEKADEQAAKEPTGKEGAASATAGQQTHSPEPSPKEVLASQYRYINAGDYDAAYELFDEQSQQMVSSKQYSAYFASVAPYEIASYSFPSVQVQDDTASLVVDLAVSSSNGEERYQVTQKMVREEGDWRVVMRNAQVASFIAQAQSPSDVLAAQYEYINNGEYEKAYALFDAQSQQLVSLEQYEAYFTNNAPYSIDNYSFSGVNVGGDVASVTADLSIRSATGDAHYRVTQQLVREDGRWRVVMREEQVAAFTDTGSGSAKATTMITTATSSAEPSGGGVPPISEEECPPSAPIKGNADSHIYHTQSSATYDETHPEVCFASEAAAQEAGYRAARD